MSEYNPDNWLLLKFDTKEHGIFYKVLAGWSGGYLYGDSWKLNSGVTKVEVDGDYYLFYGYSGSVYKCHKDSEMVRMNIAPILDQLLNTGQVTVIDTIDYIKS